MENKASISKDSGLNPLTRSLVHPFTCSPSPYHWYAIYCRSRREKEVERDLIEDGFEAYLPKIKKQRVWSDRKKWVEMPLFPSYCFVRVSNKEYYKVLQHDAIVKYVSFGGVASVIRDSHIEAIRRVLGENLDFELTSRKFRPGQVVEIGVGPMAGCCGEIVRIAGKKNLLLRVGETGYSLLVNVPVGYLEREMVTG